jgi:hypothetical protein
MALVVSSMLFMYDESTISWTVSSVLTYALLVETDWLLKSLILFCFFRDQSHTI